jgi:hypothetical protein
LPAAPSWATVKEKRRPQCPQTAKPRPKLPALAGSMICESLHPQAGQAGVGSSAGL